MKLLPIVPLLLLASAASAQTCKYVDSAGHVTYSNVPVKNAKKVSCFEPAAAPPAAQPRPSNAESAPPGTPRVDARTQRQRDDGRRNILESELKAEEERLAQARRELAEQESTRSGDERNYQRVLDRLKPYQEQVALHEKNVAAIKQELANLR
jgi:hypothetical protein